MSNFGDRVRIRRTPETEAAGVADREGNVYGFTTPSITGVSVIGGAPEDNALNVEIEGHEALWFRPDLVELVHHNAGMEIRVGNVRAVRRDDGTWDESTTRDATLLSRLSRWFRSR